MQIWCKQSVFIWNSFLFLGILLSFYYHSGFTYFLSFVGFLLNAFCFGRNYFAKNSQNGASDKIPSEPAMEEKVKIMDDLDREAERRRGIDQLNRN